jgi:hypothetical protein
VVQSCHAVLWCSLVVQSCGAVMLCLLVYSVYFMQRCCVRCVFVFETSLTFFMLALVLFLF